MLTRKIMLALAAIILLAALPAVSMAETGDVELDPELRALLEGDEELPHYHFPKIEPEYFASLGFRTVDSSGMRSLMRFGELDDTGLFSGYYRAFAFPHRFFFTYDYEGGDEYFGELRYATGDTLFLRWVGTGVYRNAESVTPIDPDASTAFPGVSIRDTGALYGVSKNTEDIYFRLKYPDLASHLFARAWMVHEDGTVQQRTLLGSGWFNGLVRDTAKREYEWETHEYTVGANSHLGPIEVEVEHTDSSFKVNSALSTMDYFTANPYRPAGYYSHHLYPDSTSQGNTIKLHTSYTGKLVAAVNLTTRDMENDYSKVGADYTYTNAAVTWMPRTSFTMFLRYKRADLDYDNTRQITAAGIRNGLSSTRDDISLTARFRPIPDLVVKGRYRVEVTDRENAREWGLASDKTTTDSYGISARTSQIKNFRVKADYTYTEVDAPAYNTESDVSHRTMATADWSASKRILAFASVTSVASKRHSLEYAGNIKADNRLSFRDSAMLGLTFMATDRLSATATYNYYLSSVKQDLVIDLGGSPAVSPDTVYEDRVNGLSLDLNYLASEKFTARTGIYYTVSESRFETHNQDLIDPLTIAALTDKKITGTTLDLSGVYSMGGGLSMEATYTYKELSEDYFNPYDALQDGDVQVATVMVSKKW